MKIERVRCVYRDTSVKTLQISDFHSGCDHMTCSRCLTQFCWACLAVRLASCAIEVSCLDHANGKQRTPQHEGDCRLLGPYDGRGRIAASRRRLPPQIPGPSLAEGIGPNSGTVMSQNAARTPTSSGRSLIHAPLSAPVGPAAQPRLRVEDLEEANRRQQQRRDRISLALTTPPQARASPTFSPAERPSVSQV